MLRSQRYIGGAVVLFLLSFAAVAKEPVGSVVGVSDLFWKTFRCSALAANYGNSSEQERLFESAYYGIKRTLDSAVARDPNLPGKMRGIEGRKEMYGGNAIAIRGPSTDFVMGRAYGIAEEQALQSLNDWDMMIYVTHSLKEKAKIKFDKDNCADLGFY